MIAFERPAPLQLTRAHGKPGPKYDQTREGRGAAFRAPRRQHQASARSPDRSISAWFPQVQRHQGKDRLSADPHLVTNRKGQSVAALWDSSDRPDVCAHDELDMPSGVAAQELAADTAGITGCVRISSPSSAIRNFFHRLAWASAIRAQQLVFRYVFRLHTAQRGRNCSTPVSISAPACCRKMPLGTGPGDEQAVQPEALEPLFSSACLSVRGHSMGS